MFQLVFRQGEEAVFLDQEHLADAAADGVDHVQIDHGIGEKAVAIAGFRCVGVDYLLHRAGDKGAGVTEAQPSVLELHHSDLATQLIVLVGNGIVKRFADDKRIVLVDLLGKQRSIRHVAVLQVADLAVDLVGVDQQRTGKVFVVTLQAVAILENPGDGGRGRVEPVCRLRFAQQQNGGTSDLPLDGQLGLVEKDLVTPVRQFGSQSRMLGGVLAASKCNSLVAQVIYMTTKLAGAATFFLPFNKGHNHGAGNPPNPTGHKSAYLWQEVFSRESVANIIQHFVRLDGSSKTPLAKRTLFFPRYHQLDVVRRLVAHASCNGVGQRYLIQHSAGSGKSNSITWAAYQLIETYPASPEVAGARGLDVPLFDSVIVVTDRRLLDKQLRENIREFSEVKNIIAPALKSADLKLALEQGKKIIITTIQKFPFIVDGIDDMAGKRFAVIIDEAHSSQDGSSHGKMNKVMGSDEQDDAQEKILSAIKKSKMRGNASYFAFTATPKNSTLEKFGEQQPDGSFQPFHLYSMKQAIEEGFILDVLANYTTYKSYYEIQKSIEGNPLFDTLKAQKKLRAHVERNQQTINAKAEIMLEHFIAHVVNPKKLKGQAKGMVVTQNIEAAIRYHKAISRLLEARGNPFKALIAFSGEKVIDGVEYSEAQINGFAEADTRDKFDSDDYRLLVVANKYLTGFDQPKLCAMYVDKKLQDVLAVQALSRLNRAAPKWGKKTEDLFILDFFNSVEDIKKSFDPFYTATSLSSATDINVLHELKDQLDEVGVYEWPEVESFAALYFDNANAEQLSPLIDTAVERFDGKLELEEEAKADFKIKAKQFVKIYGQMASIMPYEILAWEKLFWFLKFLIPKLKIKDKDADEIDALLNAVDLSSYGLERIKLNHAIELDDSETQLDPANPNPRGAHGGEQQKDPLDQIIQTFNERWFQGWDVTPEEQRVKFLSILQGIQQHPDFEAKYQQSQDEDHRTLAFEKIFEEVMLKRRRQDLELYRLLASDAAFKSSMQQSMRGLLR